MCIIGALKTIEDMEYTSTQVSPCLHPTHSSVPPACHGAWCGVGTSPSPILSAFPGSGGLKGVRDCSRLSWFTKKTEIIFVYARGTAQNNQLGLWCCETLWCLHRVAQPLHRNTAHTHTDTKEKTRTKHCRQDRNTQVQKHPIQQINKNATKHNYHHLHSDLEMS